jgi:hypothetical protein
MAFIHSVILVNDPVACNESANFVIIYYLQVECRRSPSHQSARRQNPEG